MPGLIAAAIRGAIGGYRTMLALSQTCEARGFDDSRLGEAAENIIIAESFNRVEKSLVSLILARSSEAIEPINQCVDPVCMLLPARGVTHDGFLYLALPYDAEEFERKPKPVTAEHRMRLVRVQLSRIESVDAIGEAESCPR